MAVALATDEGLHADSAPDLSKLPRLRAAFTLPLTTTTTAATTTTTRSAGTAAGAFGGTATAGNSSSINDGAAALVLVSGAYLAAHPHVVALARVEGFADAAVKPALFPLAPVVVANKLAATHGLDLASQVDCFEVNEEERLVVAVAVVVATVAAATMVVAVALVLVVLVLVLALVLVVLVVLVLVVLVVPVVVVVEVCLANWVVIWGYVLSCARARA